MKTGVQMFKEIKEIKGGKEFEEVADFDCAELRRESLTPRGQGAKYWHRAEVKVVRVQREQRKRDRLRGRRVGWPPPAVCVLGLRWVNKPGQTDVFASSLIVRSKTQTGRSVQLPGEEIKEVKEFKEVAGFDCAELRRESSHAKAPRRKVLASGGGKVTPWRLGATKTLQSRAEVKVAREQRVQRRRKSWARSMDRGRR